MPELPDVEGFRRELAGPLPGRRIRQVTVHDPGILRNVGAQSLARKLRGVWLADDDITEVTGPQGPDALGLGLRAFRKVLCARRGRLKPTLMDQSVIAGLGNLLTDEICWRARVNPSRLIADVDERDLKRLHDAMTGCCAPRSDTGGYPVWPGGLPVRATNRIRAARAAARGLRVVESAAEPRCGVRAANLSR